MTFACHRNGCLAVTAGLPARVCLMMSGRFPGLLGMQRRGLVIFRASYRRSCSAESFSVQPHLRTWCSTPQRVVAPRFVWRSVTAVITWALNSRRTRCRSSSGGLAKRTSGVCFETQPIFLSPVCAARAGLCSSARSTCDLRFARCGPAFPVEILLGVSRIPRVVDRYRGSF